MSDDKPSFGADTLLKLLPSQPQAVASYRVEFSLLRDGKLVSVDPQQLITWFIEMRNLLDLAVKSGCSRRQCGLDFDYWCGRCLACQARALLARIDGKTP